MSEKAPDYADEFDDCDPDEDEFSDFDCGLRIDGQCSMAGTETCDWDCPHSHGPYYAGSEAWNRRHDAGVPVDGCQCHECRKARGGSDG